MKQTFEIESKRGFKATELLGCLEDTDAKNIISVNELEIDHFEYDWSAVITDIVKKKDLDGHDFSDCWEEDYDWTELDKYVINNYFDECLGYMVVDLSNRKQKVPSNKKLEADLNLYLKYLELRK